MALIALHVAIVGSLLLFVYLFNGLYQSRSFSANAAAIANRLGTDIVETRTMLVSLVNHHHTVENTDIMDLSLLAEELRKQSPHVIGIGRFDHVQSRQRDDYERWMRDNRILDYRILQPSSNGQLTERSRQERYFPVSMIEPLTPAVARFIGLDVGSSQDFTARLQNAIYNDEGFFTIAHADWPAGNALLAVHPAYLGNQRPDQPDQRNQQFDGGYWIAIDTAMLLSDLPMMAGTGLTLALSDTDQATTLGSVAASLQAANSGRQRLLTSLYDALSHQEAWRFGSSELTLAISYSPGLAVSTLALVIGAVIAITVFFVAFARNLGKRRAADSLRIERLGQLNRERERAELTLNSISDPVIAVDRQGRILHVNAAAEQMLGRENDALQETLADDLLTFEHASDRGGRLDLTKALSELPAGGKTDQDVRIWQHAPRNGIYTLSDENQIIKLTLSRSDSARTGSDHESFILVMRDVSLERKLSCELEYQASHDALTGCFNRYYFEKRLSRIVEDVHASRREHALIYFDLDQFKIVNDTCGHPAGDRLLKELTENLHSIIRQSDVLARLGGDEFGLIVLDTRREHAERVAQKLFDFFQTYTFYHERKAFPVRASIGFVPINTHSGNLHDIMSAADIACYASKDGGRNSLHLYSEDDEALSKRQQDLNWLPRLRHALENDEFRMLIQPIAGIHPQTGELTVTHYEFLIRLVDKSGNEITPYQFISAAERYDLMAEVDRWVIDHAISQVGDHNRHGRFLGKTFSINLSGQSAADPELASFIRNCFQRHDVAAGLFWFEITETAAISHFSVARQLFEELRAMGARVALDDFGSGLSSFGYLKNLPVDVLKIDGQFIRNLADNPIDQEMVRAIHGVACAMGIDTVAEFVESQAVVDCLREIGVGYAQGYFISKPATFPQAERDAEERKAA